MPRSKNRARRRKDAPALETDEQRSIRTWDWLATNNGASPNPTEHREPERAHVTQNGRGSVGRLTRR